MLRIRLTLWGIPDGISALKSRYHRPSAPFGVLDRESMGDKVGFEWKRLIRSATYQTEHDGSSFHMPGPWSLRSADRGVRPVSAFEDVHDRKSYRRRQRRTLQSTPCASIQGKEYLALDFVGLCPVVSIYRIEADKDVGTCPREDLICIVGPF